MISVSVDKLALMGRNVLLELEELETKTASGLILVHADEHKYRWQSVARVVRVGPDVARVGQGDNVLFERHAGRLMQFGGRDYLMLDEADLLAKVDA